MIERVVQDIRAPRTYGRILYLLLAFPLGLVWFVVLVTGISLGLGLAVTLVGLPVLAAMLYLSRWMAQFERRVIHALLGVEIADPYRPEPAGGTWWDRLRARVADPATWKDLMFLVLQFPLGTLSFSLAVTVLSSGGWLLSAPSWYSVTDNWAFYGLLDVDTLVEAILLVPVGALILVVGIPALGALGRLYGWFAIQLLGSNADPELTAEVSDLRDSRARVIAAADAERRRLERDLHDGAQQRLVSLALTLRMAEQRAAKGDEAAVELVRQAGDEAGLALGELRDLARGLHPAILTNRGLAAALEDLAGRATVPVEVATAPEERLPDQVEAAAYFVVSECLANVDKHAEASSATVRAGTSDGVLAVEVADDGVGGAGLDGGSGLRGLDDRVGALDGSIAVASPPGGGTRVIARLPLTDLPHGERPVEPRSLRILADADAEAALARRRDLLKPRLIVVGAVALVLVAIWALTPSPTFWPIWPLIGLGAVAAIDALLTLVALPVRESDLAGASGRTAAARDVHVRRLLTVKAGLAGIVNLVVIALWAAAGGGYFWPVWVLLATSLALALELARHRYAS